MYMPDANSCSAGAAAAVLQCSVLPSALQPCRPAVSVVAQHCAGAESFSQLHTRLRFQVACSGGAAAHARSKFILQDLRRSPPAQVEPGSCGPGRHRGRVRSGQLRQEVGPCCPLPVGAGCLRFRLRDGKWGRAPASAQQWGAVMLPRMRAARVHI